MEPDLSILIFSLIVTEPDYGRVTIMRLCYLSLIAVLVLQYPSSASPSLDADKLPSIETVKQSLLPYWEQTIRNDPGTKLFEKTTEPGIYRIQTNVLPYSGRVKVLNLVVDVYKPVGKYDRQVAYGGVVETELMDAPKDIAINQPFSLQRWQRMGWFDYDTTTSTWFPFNTWDKHFPMEKRLSGGAPSQRKARSGI